MKRSFLVSFIPLFFFKHNIVKFHCSCLSNLVITCLVCSRSAILFKKVENFTRNQYFYCSQYPLSSWILIWCLLLLIEMKRSSHLNCVYPLFMSYFKFHLAWWDLWTSYNVGFWCWLFAALVCALSTCILWCLVQRWRQPALWIFQFSDSSPASQRIHHRVWSRGRWSHTKH